MLAKLPDAERGVFETRAKSVVDLLSNKGFGQESGFLAMAVTVRLMALDSIMSDPRSREWLLPSSDAEITYVHADLLRVAVAEPILEDRDGQPVFASHSFFQRLLQIAASRGHG